MKFPRPCMHRFGFSLSSWPVIVFCDMAIPQKCYKRRRLPPQATVTAKLPPIPSRLLQSPISWLSHHTTPSKAKRKFPDHGSLRAVHAVNLWSGISHAHKDGELSTSMSADDLLAANSRVVDQSGRLDIINRALAGLVVGGEAPRVHLAVASNCKAIVRARSNRRNIGNI